MSRIGNAPIMIPKDVTVTVNRESVAVKGPKGELSVRIPNSITLAYRHDRIDISRERDSGSIRALHGYTRAAVHNAITGVTNGFSKTLELFGVGYRASMNGASLVLAIGFSHPVVIDPPSGITLTVSEGKVIISGIDRQIVGQIAAKIRAVKKPEPYKGKGIRYEGEFIRKKAGKSAKAIGGAPGASK